VYKKKEEAPAAPAPKPDDVVLLEEIRDILKEQK
jgi:large conductance mechanosensitive channel